MALKFIGARGWLCFARSSKAAKPPRGRAGDRRGPVTACRRAASCRPAWTYALSRARRGLPAWIASAWRGLSRAIAVRGAGVAAHDVFALHPHRRVLERLIRGRGEVAPAVLYPGWRKYSLFSRRLATRSASFRGKITWLTSNDTRSEPWLSVRRARADRLLVAT